MVVEGYVVGLGENKFVLMITFASKGDMAMSSCVRSMNGQGDSYI